MEGVDVHKNPVGRNYDLGHEKAFGMFGIILFDFKYVSIMFISLKEILDNHGLKTNGHR